MLDKSTVVNTVTRYAEAVSKEFSPLAVILFGSYINGTPNEDSDIDVGVVFNDFEGDYLKATQRLWRLRREVSYDIEPHLLDTAHDPSGFTKHVLATGQVIYHA
ncbi:MAG: nucleotidyltransferase domain-containing protein [Clostridiales Family XIII bacterium]|jgi:predicted nucleotidyltransferase|nr:nucleotidyltransferase domain-containing protein [Clostridiales Family XIII bacterium]